MSTAIETLPSRHKVSWKGWLIALLAAAIVAGAFGTYMALRSPSGSSPSIVQTVNPQARITPVENLQPGSGGQVIPNRIDGKYLPTPIAHDEGTQGSVKADTGSTASTAPGSPIPGCLNTLRAGPC
jgi:hypothetical protein